MRVARWSFLLALVLMISAAVAFNKGSEVEVECGPQVTYSATYRGVEAAGKAGGVVDAWRHSVEDGKWSKLDTFRAVKGTIDTLTLWWSTFRAAALGEPEPDLARAWRENQEEQARVAVASCCPPTAQPAPPEAPAPGGEWDPKNASITTAAAAVGRSTGDFTAEQVRIASTAARVANERSLPREALVDVLMAGFVESGIRNLSYGDRDSQGWLQQRPSAGWGTVAQIRDPAYAAGRFYDALVKVPNWRTRPAGQVVQAVQISAYPDRYASWQDEAEQLAAQVGGTGALDQSAVTGAAQSCGGSPDAKVVTWNVYTHNSTANVLRGIKALADDGADVIALQEVPTGERRHLIAQTFPEFKVAGMDSATPVLVRADRFSITEEQTKLITPRHAPMEGPQQGARFVVSVTLRDVASGSTFSVINLHALPRVQKSGQLHTAWDTRIGEYRDQRDYALGRAQTLRAQGPVDILGDLNFDGDPDGAYGKAGFLPSGSLDTHGDRDIDRQWLSGMTATSEKLFPHFGSDHQPRMATFVASSATPADRLNAAVSGGTVTALPGQSTPDQAIQWMSARDGQSGWGARCLAAVGQAYGHQGTTPVNKHYYATGQWDATPSRYRHPGTSTPPRGALVYWRTSNVAGHIAISAGGGKVWTTDPPGAYGTIGLADISDLDTWGPRLGWSEPYFVGKTGVAA